MGLQARLMSQAIDGFDWYLLNKYLGCCLYAINQIERENLVVKIMFEDKFLKH